ncbi:MAG TPA: hypothetical protein VFM54_18790 [Micromonosporaceae bacterium]|nr:hypothetical protein [Micromonosporaceae bacterium]
MDVHAAVDALLARSRKTVNVRSFLPDADKGNPFHYGLEKAGDVVALVESLAAHGYFTIVNETVDIHDGGVSGVTLNDLIEFVPEDTPRGVEGPDAASLPYRLGIEMLTTVFGFRPELPGPHRRRVEFSLHPLKVGYRKEHTLVWDMEPAEAAHVAPTLVWPNRFSRFIGDKAYGLLLADKLGLPVPATTVVGRSVAPFSFGRRTGTAEVWTRPCPHEQAPGLYPTSPGWTDPYELLRLGEPPGSAIASILSQEGVTAAYSGATMPDDQGDWVEGVAGTGDAFMQGQQAPIHLPGRVTKDVRAVAEQARRSLGQVRLEYAHDGDRAWVLQLHLSTDRFRGTVICPGTPEDGWLDFDPRAGLDDLRELIEQAADERRGIRVTGAVGVTSHVGDLLRRAAVPAVMEIPPAGPPIRGHPRPRRDH